MSGKGNSESGAGWSARSGASPTATSREGGNESQPTWTHADEERARAIRETEKRRPLTDSERRELRALRQREINESIRRRNARQ